jgi:HupE / UreJ protein
MSRLALSIAAPLIASTAQAHTGVDDTNGFVHGFTHPISGIDHILAWSPSASLLPTLAAAPYGLYPSPSYR